MAYYDVVPIMELQGIAFEISRSDLAFDGFEPDRDVLGA
jgi:hypothetical protein